MFEELLEDIAQKNGLRETNTYLKLAAGLGAILLCLLSSSYLPPLFIAVVLSCAILFLARVNARTYAELFVFPLWFAGMSAAGIILISGGNEVFWQWIILPDFSFSITRDSLNHGYICFLPGCWRDVRPLFYLADNAHDRYFYRIPPVQGTGSRN